MTNKHEKRNKGHCTDETPKAWNQGPNCPECALDIKKCKKTRWQIFLAIKTKEIRETRIQ